MEDLILCEYCKSRNTWDCEDFACRRCENFDLDFDALPRSTRYKAARYALDDLRTDPLI